jgi:hypothetical protein
MNTVPQRRTSVGSLVGMFHLFSAVLALPCIASRYGTAAQQPVPSTVKVDLSEWKVQLSPATVPSGPVIFEVSNVGKIPHALEVEGGGIEKSMPQIKPGATATLKLDLRAGSYEAYCPVGKGSHKMLGMVDHLTVGGAKPAPAVSAPAAGAKAAAAASAPAASATAASAKAATAASAKPAPAASAKEEEGEEYTAGKEKDEYTSGKEKGEYTAAKEGYAEHEHGEEQDGSAKMMKVTGGGPVIQILPGPFPFADSAMAVIHDRPADQQADLSHKAHMGPYSNNVAPISGDISVVAIDRGSSGDSVSGVARFATQDGARWKLVIDRVQTKDIPFNPRFGGVIMGLFYHGASGVHTPLVPTIQSSLALWAYAHLYKNDQLVTDDAMVHIMQLSRTRRTSDWALDCWDCSDRPIEELQLQVTPAPNTPPFDAPGGFLFVNWEKSRGEPLSF